MKEYYKYIEDVRTGRIKTCLYIKQMVERLEKMKQREDLYFDEAAVKECFEFIRQIKHFAGKSAGKNFDLMPWQKWVVGSVIGIKHRDTGFRVCREMFLLISRKNGKTSLIAALSLYMLIADGEASPSIGCVASSRDQARLLFEMAQQFGKSLDPKEQHLKNYRNYIKFTPNNGEFKVFSSDSSNLDGLSLSCAILDEGHAQKDNLLYSVLKSSMGFRQQPLMVQITTCGFLLDGYPCFETYKVSIEILAGVKEQDEFFPFLYMLDPDDDWQDEENWVKCNPCLDITITREYLRDQMRAALNDSTQEVPIKTKNFNIWMSSAMQWIPQEIVASCMQKKIEVEDFAGWPCTIGMDLGSVSDFTSFSALWVLEGKFYFKTWTFLPEATLPEHPDRLLYERFIKEGSMIITDGNCTNYDFICAKIGEISQICPIDAIYTDAWNATSTMITLTNMGFNVIPFSQSIGHFNAPTKSMEKHIRDGEAVIDRSQNVLWQFGNAELTMDHNGNQKVTKGTGMGGSKGGGSGRQRKKVDSVISMTTALGGFEEKGAMTDFTIFSLD